MLAPRQECPSPPFSLLVVKVGSLGEGCKSCQNCPCPPGPGQCRGSDPPLCWLPSLRPAMVLGTSAAVAAAAAAWPTVAAVAASRASAVPQVVEAVAAVSSAAPPTAFAAVVLVAPTPENQTVGYAVNRSNCNQLSLGATVVSAGDSDSDIDGDLDQALSQLLQARPAPLRPDQEALLLLLKTSLRRRIDQGGEMLT